jgi:PhnB protein
MTDVASETRSFDPRVMMGVIPYLGMNGRAAEAVGFYTRAFGARELGRFASGDDPNRLIHVQIEVNGGALMMSDMTAPGEPPASPQGFHLQLVVQDGDAWWSRAVEAGCEVVMPLQRMFWGDRFGLMRDPFGLQWAVNEAGAPGGSA